MTKHRDPHGVRSIQQQLIDRLRFILAICATVATGFVLRELVEESDVLGARFVIRVTGIALAVFAIVLFKRAWAVRYAWPLSIAVVCFAYALTASAGMVSASGDYLITAVLFVGAALTTATLLPWNLRAQLLTVSVGALTLGAAIVWKDGNLAMLGTDPGAAVVMAFILSAVTANEFHRYRMAHRRELLERERAEGAVRRLNAHLEERVADRTAALQSVNDRLAAEIAERRRAAEALRASEALLADTVDHSTAIVSLKSVHGRYLLVNRQFEQLVGCDRTEVVGRRDGDLFPAALAARLSERDQDVIAGGVPLSFEQELPAEGGPHTYVCVKFPLQGPGGTPYGVGSMATDITVLKQLQEELRRHQDELAHVLRLHTIGEMAAALAHEINQPLCAITNYAQGGVQRLRAGIVEPEALLQAFEHVAAEGLRAAQILRSIRGLVQRESGEETAVDVNALAGDAVRVLEPQARLHGVTVRLDSGVGLPSVQANATQIEQVMVNLLLNGVQALAGGRHAQREVVVATTRQGDHVEVAITDTGAGIETSVSSKLFSPFVTTKARGLGLGLAISRTIVENHGGRLWAMPNTGPGATFRFSLPIGGESGPAASA